MLKKFFSKAILPLVMEKNARDKLAKIRTAKNKADTPSQSELLHSKANPKPPPTNPARSAKPADSDHLLDALNRLEKALDEGTLNGSVKTMNARRALIRQALAIQRDKTKIFGDLSTEDKLRLHLMAKKIMTPGRD